MSVFFPIYSTINFKILLHNKRRDLAMKKTILSITTCLMIT